MSMEIDSLEVKIKSNADQASAGLDKLTTVLRNLKSVSKGGAGLTAVANQLSKLNTALSGITVNTGKLGEVAVALDGLSSVQKASGLTTTVNALKKLPDVTRELEKADLNEFAVQMERVASAVRPLATEMQKVSGGFSAFPIRIQKLIASNEGLAASNQRTGKSFSLIDRGITGTISKLTILGYGIKQLWNAGKDFVNESTKYVEDLNLFSVAMGDGAQAAFDYAQAVHDALGIDPAEWMRNQGVFKQITSGFGVVEDKANLMSKNLTQIGYDISSFFNISIEESMQKVQSGIAGELEPLRRLGYALDVATLQEVAYKNGIEMKVNAMTQAQKSQLRYIAIMEQSGNVMGDMARTIMTPANAMRVLDQQITQLKRAFGNVLIPALMSILPYIQALVELLTEAIQRLAMLVGFELPEIDYSGLGSISSGATDAEDALNGATGAAKKLKNATLGIDELNILSEQTGGSGGIGTGGSDLGIDLPEYDFLGELSSKTGEIKEKIKEMLGPITGIAAGFAAWKIAKSALGWFADLKNGKFKSIGDVANGVNKTAIGLGLMVTGFTIEWSGGFDMGYNGPNIKNVVQTAIGAALGIGGSLLVFGTGPLGWTIGVGMALTVGIASFTMGYDKKKLEEDLSNRFGDIELDEMEISALVNLAITPEWAEGVKLHIELVSDLESYKSKIDEDIKTMNKIGWKVNMGIALTENDKSAYQQAVTDYVNNCNDYVQTRGYAIEVGIRATLGESEVADSIIASTSAISLLVSNDISRLGTELQGTLNTAFGDGILSIDEQEAIETLTTQINSIMEIVAQSEFEAKLDVIDLKYGGAQMTPESWETFKTEMYAVGDEMKANAETSVTNALSSLRADVNIAEFYLNKDPQNEEYQKLLNDAKDALQNYIDSNPMETMIDDVDFKINDQIHLTLSNVFAEEVEKAEPIIQQNVQSLFVNGTTAVFPDQAYDNIETLVTNMQDALLSSIQNADISPEARQNLKTQIADSIPELESLKEEVDKGVASGKGIAESVKTGMTDIYTWKSLSSDVAEQMEGITFLIGQKLSDDPAFFDMLTKADDFGYFLNKELAYGINSNVQFVEDAATDTVGVFKNGIEVARLDVTPDLVTNMGNLGVELSNSVVSSMSDTMNGKKKDLQAFSEEPMKAFKEVNKIGTTAPVFNGLGGNISDGLMSGIQGKRNELYSYAANWARGITKKVEKELGIHSPSRVFRDEIGMNLGLGLADGLTQSAGSVLSAADDLMGGVKNAFGEIELPVMAAYDGISGYYDEKLVSSLSFTGEDASNEDEAFKAAVYEQNALLRRQNEILMELLEKKDPVYLDSRELTNRQEEVSRMYGR